MIPHPARLGGRWPQAKAVLAGRLRRRRRLVVAETAEVRRSARRSRARTTHGKVELPLALVFSGRGGAAGLSNLSKTFAPPCPVPGFCRGRRRVELVERVRNQGCPRTSRNAVGTRFERRQGRPQDSAMQRYGPMLAPGGCRLASRGAHEWVWRRMCRFGRRGVSGGDSARAATRRRSTEPGTLRATRRRASVAPSHRERGPCCGLGSSLLPYAR